MRRFALCAFAVLAIGLMLAPGALASTGVKHVAPLGTRHAAMAQPLAVPAAAGSYSITGHVLDYSGNLVQRANVAWGWWDGSAFNYGGFNSVSGTALDGAFHFASVESEPGNNDFLDVYYPSGSLEELYPWSLDFATRNDLSASPNTYEIQPAQVNLTSADAPTGLVQIKVGEQDVGFAQSGVQFVSGSAVAGVLPPSFDDVVAFQQSSDGAVKAATEWLGTPVTVAAGATAPGTVALDWSKAQYAYLAGPLCRHSGKAGSTVTMTLKDWPVGEWAQLAGYTSVASYNYGVGPTSTDAAATYNVPLKVASSAPVGIYEFDAYRADNQESFVDLYDYYQVCTFKPSASAIHYGHTVRLSGVVPAPAGKAILYSTTHKVSSQPSTLAAKGWVKLGTYKVSSRKFVTGLLHPKRTTWYVVRYNGNRFQAFTSVIKVTVH